MRGQHYTHEIFVLPLKNMPDKLRTGDINPLRVKQYEFSLLDETFVFPAKQVIADDQPCSPDELEYEPGSHLQPGEAAAPEEVLMEDPPAPAEGLADHDPDHMPDGSAVPPTFRWDGFRLVKARKSSRPRGIPSEMWQLASPKERACVAEGGKASCCRRSCHGRLCSAQSRCQGGTVKKIPSPAAVASAIPEALAPAMPVTVNEKGKTVHEHRACQGQS